MVKWHNGKITILVLYCYVVVRKLKLSLQLPHSSAKLHRGRPPAGSRVWTQHFSGVSIWGQAQGLLFSTLLLHYWIRGLPQTWNWTQQRGNMQIWCINKLQWKRCGRKASSRGKLAGLDQIETEQWKISLCFNRLSFSCTFRYVDIYMYIQKYWDMYIPQHTHTQNKHTCRYKTHTRAPSPEGLH